MLLLKIKKSLFTTKFGFLIQEIAMLQTLTKSKKLFIELPDSLLLQVTQEQFEVLAAVNRDLRLERTAKGDLI